MDPLKPDVATLTKLGSIARHAQELASPTGHAFDLEALRALLEDPDVVAWLEAADELALLPVAR